MLTYHIITFGCQMNRSDSERVTALLEKNGYKYSDNKYQADLVVVNTCGIRQSAENRIYGLIPRIKKESAIRQPAKRTRVKIVLTGCLAEREDVKRRLKKYVDVWLPIGQMSNFKFPISKIPLTPFIKGAKHCDYLNIQPKHQSKFSAFVPIGNGCNNFCSYCVVPAARGREVYRKAEDILDEVKELVEKGYKEIILIAQNVNSYKSPIPSSPPLSRGEDFADLLKAVNDIKGDFWIRFFTSYPKDMSDKLIKTMAKCEKVCRQVHLPAQAGDDKILKAMNRKYTRADYIKLVRKIRRQLNPPYLPLLKGEIWHPPVSITTDIIVGFPGETKKQFAETAKLMRLLKFDMAYLAQYSARPGTLASKMADNVPASEKRRREQALNEILKKTALINNKKYIGKTVAVLVESKNRSGEWVGKTRTGKVVKLEIRNLKFGRTNLLGEIVKVKIIKARDFGLEGEIA